MLMEKILLENIIKNVLLAVILIFTYAPIDAYLQTTNIVTDLPLAGDILVAVSILIVTACFGNYAFTYEKTKKNHRSRFLAHATTFVLMLLLGLAIEMTSVLSHFLVGHFFMFDFALLLLYVATVLYDFWDLERIDV